MRTLKAIGIIITDCFLFIYAVILLNVAKAIGADVDGEFDGFGKGE